MEEKKNDPQFKPAIIDVDKPVTIKLTSSKQIAQGESKYGTWNLWAIEVENQTVVDKEKNTDIPNYSGKAVMFPSTKLHEQFLGITGGNKENCEVEISVTPKKGPRGFYTQYDAKLISEGEISSESVGYGHNKYMDDFKKFAENKILDETEETFVEFGSKEPYNHKVDFLKDLWKTYKTKNGV